MLWSLCSLRRPGRRVGGGGVSLTWQLVAVGTTIAAGVVLTRSGLVVGDAGDTVGIVADGPPAGSVDRHGSEPPVQARAPRRRRTVGPLVVLGAATIGGAVIEGAPAGLVGHPA